MSVPFQKTTKESAASLVDAPRKYNGATNVRQPSTDLLLARSRRGWSRGRTKPQEIDFSVGRCSVHRRSRCRPSIEAPPRRCGRSMQLIDGADFGVSEKTSAEMHPATSGRLGIGRSRRRRRASIRWCAAAGTFGRAPLKSRTA